MVRIPRRRPWRRIRAGRGSELYLLSCYIFLFIIQYTHYITCITSYLPCISYSSYLYRHLGREVTHEALCALPLESAESCGQGIGAIPQTRPELPVAPPVGSGVMRLRVQDGQPISLLSQLSGAAKKGGLAMAALAGKTFMEVGGARSSQEVAAAMPASTALGMARLAGQALMEA